MGWATTTFFFICSGTSEWTHNRQDSAALSHLCHVPYPSRDHGHERQIAPGEHYGEDAAAAGSAAGELRPTGKVAGIIRRNWRTRGYAGSLQPPGEGRALRRGSANVLFCPVERRFPFIRIQTRQARPRPEASSARCFLINLPYPTVTLT